jgi:hypothetical protein
MIGTPSELANAQALAAAQQRVTTDAALSQELGTDLGSRQYSADDTTRLTKLKGELDQAGTEIQAEVDARSDLQDAYDDSTFANKDADPTVKAKKQALAQVRAANRPVIYKGQNLVNSVCQPCIQRDIDKMMDCNTPYHVTYADLGGPQYKACHDHTLGDYPGWNDLIQRNVKTPSEKNVLVAMSANEADMDGVQAYDSQTLSAGAMQKTVNPAGAGELPQQLYEFRSDPATAPVFQRELGDKGYSVDLPVIGQNTDGTPMYGDKPVLSFTDPKTPGAMAITGAALKNMVRTQADRWTDTLGPFRSLGRTPEFQTKQVLDFNDRLVSSLDKTPTGYAHSIGDYVTSENGSALVLDQDVNAPGFVQSDFGRALKSFYAGTPGAPVDPATWTDAQRAAYEPAITSAYSAVRRGTDMGLRATNLAGAGLSNDPGSLSFPGD